MNRFDPARTRRNNDLTQWIGRVVPDFELPAHDGRRHRLSGLNRRLVLFFYPKDMTPGCTMEACGLRDRFEELSRHAVLWGVSPDSVESHRRFAEKHRLPFLLLSDEDKAVCRLFGVWVKKSFYGRSYHGVARTTFVIGPDRRCEAVFGKVDPRTHAADLLQYFNIHPASGPST